MVFNIKNLSVSYGKYKVLDNVSIDIPKGKFTSILGSNGSGKSTIVKAIAQNIDVDNGEILFLNKEISKYKKKNLAKKITYLLQFNTVAQEITVFDYISYGRTPFKSLFKPLNKDDYEKIKEAIRLTSLTGYEKRSMTSLSGGEKQRVYLAMCIAQNPEVIILDEPTNHLDIKYQYELLSLLKEINEKSGVTIICVLHDINQAIKFSDRLVLLKNKKVFAQGTIENTITEENIEEVFGIKVMVHDTKEWGKHIDYLV